MVEHLQHRVDRTGLWIFSAVHQPTDPRVSDGPGAHGAGFHRDVAVAVWQAVVADDQPGFAQGLNFGMRRRIVVGDRAIAAATYDMAVLYYDCANGHLSQRLCALSFTQRFLHEELVGV